MIELKDVEKGMGRKGKTYLINFLKGKRLTRQQAICAKCYDCGGMGDTGECNITTCPLHSFSQFKSKS